jgi:hypothetical protein
VCNGESLLGVEHACEALLNLIRFSRTLREELRFESFPVAVEKVIGDINGRIFPIVSESLRCFVEGRPILKGQIDFTLGKVVPLYIPAESCLGEIGGSNEQGAVSIDMLKEVDLEMKTGRFLFERDIRWMEHPQLNTRDDIAQVSEMVGAGNVPHRGEDDSQIVALGNEPGKVSQQQVHQAR